MALDGLSSGVSHTVAFNDLSGNLPYFTAAIESFTWKADSNTEKFVQMNGRTRHVKFYSGGSGSFTVGREGPEIDNYFIAQENNYLSGGNQIDVSITETIVEANGSTSQYVFRNCVLNLDDSGTWSGTDIVKMNVSFMYEKRDRVL